jgi:septal ring factor EnvC (AmiA/AmiB activator)
VSHYDTQRLTRSSLELSSRDARRRRNVVLAVAALATGLAALGAFHLRAAPGPVSRVALEQENDALRAELGRLRTELELEKATRAELNREAGELHARITDLTNQLEFLAARDQRVAGSR